MSMFDQNSEGNNGGTELTPEQALEALVGEGKKYGTPAELAKALLHANNHIGVLEAETADLRKVGDQTAKIQEMLEKLANPAQLQQQQTQDQGKPEPVDIDKLLEEKLNKHLGVQTQAQNQAQVIKHFQTTFGDKGAEYFNKLSSELGIPKEELEAMSANRPQAVIKLAERMFTVTQQQGSASLQGNSASIGKTNAPGAMPSTKSELIKLATEQKWSRAKKYEALNAEMSKAVREGRLDSWNR